MAYHDKAGRIAPAGSGFCRVRAAFSILCFDFPPSVGMLKGYEKPFWRRAVARVHSGHHLHPFYACGRRHYRRNQPSAHGVSGEGEEGLSPRACGVCWVLPLPPFFRGHHSAALAPIHVAYSPPSDPLRISTVALNITDSFCASLVGSIFAATHILEPSPRFSFGKLSMVYGLSPCVWNLSRCRRCFLDIA